MHRGRGNRILILSTALLLLLMVVPSADAGTFFFGAKGWYTWWDSGVLSWLEQDIGERFNKSGIDFETTRAPGTGILGGPLVGYQFNDRLSISLAAMAFSLFSQSWDGEASTMSVDGEAALKRQDYDLAVNYVLGRYLRLYAGYKFQYMDLEFDLTYTSPMVVTETYSVTSMAHIPTIGAGAVYPIGRRIAIGGQAGVLYALIDMKLEPPTGDVENIWPNPGLGLNGEANVTFVPFPDFVVQAGYRYQVFMIRARGPGREKIRRTYDITYGPTLALFYTF